MAFFKLSPYWRETWKEELRPPLRDFIVQGFGVVLTIAAQPFGLLLKWSDVTPWLRDYIQVMLDGLTAAGFTTMAVTMLYRMGCSTIRMMKRR